MIKSWLSRTNNFWFTTYTLIAAFGVYFCMYAFRKPYTAASFDNKELLVIAQVIGYMLSKFWGIKYVPELKGQNRILVVLFLVGFAELMLLFFGLFHDALGQFDVVLLFLNGVPLGVIWGIVFSYLEGRRFTEILAAGLTISFIISSGVVKSVGKFTMIDWGISEYWMPFTTGLIFLPLIVLFVLMLAQVPPPNEEDKALRTARPPMMGKDRIAFFKSFAPGLVLLTISYMFVTAFRDIRDTFANEIWAELGVETASIFTESELPVGIFTGIILALCFKFKDNQLAFRFYHFLVLLGLAIIFLSTLAFTAGWLSPLGWMILLGMGGYMAYVTYGSVMYDRLIGMFHYPATAGFMIYVSDAFGYLGSVLIMLYKRFAQPNLNWLDFFIGSTYVFVVSAGVLVILSLFYFRRKYQAYALQTSSVS